MWLEERARAAGYRSLRGLARAAVEDRHWPDAASGNPDSLAAVLSRINRGEGRTWLQRRPRAAKVLARLLGQPAARLLLEAGDDQLLPAPVAVELFPGVPSEVLAVEGWGRLWWHDATGGAGQLEVGRSLAAQGRAELVQAETWDHALDQLPAAGAAFVLLASADGFGGSAPPGLRLCVAASFARPRVARREGERELAGRDGAWQTVGSPASGWRERICDWMGPRLDARYDPAEALAFLGRRDPDGQLFDSPLAVIGLCRLLDERGARGLGRAGPDRWVDDWLARRLEEGWLHDHAPRLLRGIVHDRLERGDGPWFTARKRSGWEACIPQDVVRPPDVGRARRLLREGKTKTALRALEPGPAEIVASLIEAGLLEPVGAGRFVLRPVWLFRLLEEAVVARRLASRRPGQWGALCVRPHRAADTIERLVARLRDGEWERAERAVRALDTRDPAAVAAVEGIVRAAGLAALAGSPPPRALARKLCAAQAELLFDEVPGDPPAPAVDLETDEAVAPALRRGVWTLAVLALSERAGKRTALPDCLDPWHADAQVPRLHEVLGRVQEAVLDRGVNEWTTPALELVSRLPMPPLHPGWLVWPGHIMLAFGAGNAQLLLDLASFPGPPVAVLDFTETLARRQGVAWRHVARVIWLAWRHSESDYVPDLLRHDFTDARRMWRAIPRAALLLLLHEDWPVAFRHLGLRQWRIVFGERSQVYAPKWQVPWRRAPTRAVAWAARAGLLADADYHVLRELWAAHGAIVQDAFDVALEEDDIDVVLALLASAPAERTPDLVASLEQDPTDEEGVRRWLHQRVAWRAPGWERAYAMLA